MSPEGVQLVELTVARRRAITEVWNNIVNGLNCERAVDELVRSAAKAIGGARQIVAHVFIKMYTAL